MNLHEYQSKKILQKYAILVHPFFVAEDEKEILEGVKKLNVDRYVVKAQVHAGGRGKAGGIKVCDKEELVSVAKSMLGKRLKTKQTVGDGAICTRVLICEFVEVEKEYYLGIVVNQQPTFLVSKEGGVEIEEVVKKNPEKILSIPFSWDSPLNAAKICDFLDLQVKWSIVFETFARIFLEKDLSILEINPFVKDKKGLLWALDAKMVVDDNALFRQPDLKELNDLSQLNEMERRAHKQELSYISMSGNIGCIVNGAGLAMATMDLLKKHGGLPANFLDVGGGVSKEQVAESIKLIALDKRVKVILINIFGGIVRCDLIARGILMAAQDEDMVLPLVVRLEGTNVEEGKNILVNSGLPIIFAEDLKEAATKAVECLS